MCSRCSSSSASLWIWSMVLGPWSPRRGTQLFCRGQGRREEGTELAGGRRQRHSPLPAIPPSKPQARLLPRPSPCAVAAFGTKGLNFQSPPALNSCQLLCAHYHDHANQGLGPSMASLGLATASPPGDTWSAVCQTTQASCSMEPSRGRTTVPRQQRAKSLTCLRSITSCSMKRIRDDVFFSLMIFSI